eukprot:8931409-Ditylum_brightwellii.AAC.1
MVMKVHSNALYLSKKQAQNRARGCIYLGNKYNDKFNGPLHIVSTILCNVMAATVKATLSALFKNAEKVAPFCIVLQELRHPQLATPIQVDNSTANGQGKARPVYNILEAR